MLHAYVQHRTCPSLQYAASAQPKRLHSQCNWLFKGCRRLRIYGDHGFITSGRVACTGQSTPGEKNEVETADRVLTTFTFDEEDEEGMGEFLDDEVQRLSEVIGELAHCPDVVRKVEYLKTTPPCCTFMDANSVLGASGNNRQHLIGSKPAFQAIEARMDVDQVYTILSLVVMGQKHIMGSMQETDAYIKSLDAMTSNLVRLEKFYDSLGGLVGYQRKSLQLIRGGTIGEDTEQASSAPDDDIEYLMPSYLNMSDENSPEVKTAVTCGVQAVPEMSEIYALGGAGDRLGLECPKTGDPLPAAMLPYCGRTMLDLLLRDLQAREYLHFRITGEQSTTPVGIMTSDAKANDRRIRGLLESRGWYGRGQDSFFLFKQPLVPVVRIPDGHWLMIEPLRLVMKPGGHGVIWKLMEDEGVFDWMINNGRKGAIVRQISNPMAGTDTTLLGLSGMGHLEDRSMGFASCERVVGASEGMNVLLHRHVESTPRQGGGNGSKAMAHEYGITNIEYTEFERLGISDTAISDESNTSCFPANTNILYIGLLAAQAAVKKGTQEGGGAALPGLIFNMKKMVKYLDAQRGVVMEEHGGRMECMMQNLADSLVDRFHTSLRESDAADLSTFMVVNERRKVTSSAKRKKKEGISNIRQTPEGSFWDLMGNAHALLERCGMQVPEARSPEEYVVNGPSFIFLFNPCLGPLWEVISQKIQGRSLALGSELVLEIAEARVTDLKLDGSLIVHSSSVTGHKERLHTSQASTEPSVSTSSDSIDVRCADARLASDSCTSSEGIVFSERCGRVRLERVTVANKGIDWDNEDNVYWEHKVARTESMQVRLNGCSEFDARDVTISGDCVFEVPDGFKMKIRQDGGDVVKTLVPLNLEEAWNWRYEMSDDNLVSLSWKEESTQEPAVASYNFEGRS